MKNKVELLSPAGDSLSVKSAVQNGADAIYVGADEFSARASASNFTMEELKEVIKYAHIHDVKVHLALNTLIKNNEFTHALSIAKKAYEYGIDAIIVQDLGLAMKLIKYFPKLPIHASTQMTINNLNGVKTLERLGFKRIVLAREVSLQEMEYICRNTDVEIEAFIHGALCISYSGQCLMSSMIGGRSANRGKCAQACRLPYELLQDNKVIDKGYLLSPRDLCALEFIPDLIKAGVTSFKIEGRLKSPEYVAIVTRVYRKYIDMYYSGEKFEIAPKDQSDLRQAFNRGNFSTGHLNRDANQDFVCKEKQNNMGIYIGNVSNYNDKKGYISLNLNETLALGDSITFENEPTKYRVSELMFQNKNIPFACNNELITIGRMKGNIAPGDKIFKITSKKLSDEAKLTFSGKEFKKIKLQCKVTVKADTPISVSIIPLKEYDSYKNISVNIQSEIIPEKAINQPITKEKIIAQFSKTHDTPFEFTKIDVDLDEGLYISHLSKINALRREALEKIEFLIERKFTRVPVEIKEKSFTQKEFCSTKFSLLLSQINPNFDYNKLEQVDRVYVPLRCFRNVKNKNVIKTITSKFNTYIYLPAVINLNYLNLLDSFIASFVATYDIKGFVFSSIGELRNFAK
ncbi:MAG: U32 family peptidase [Clostridia bacterium]|nr:U32 family peptidase [Clostridia bacterium]